MVARIVTGKSIRGMLTYNEKKVEVGEALLILASGFATEIGQLNFHQKLYRFVQLTMLNTRSKSNAMHISLNFHKNDLLNAGTLQQIASEYMERVGLGDQPYIVYQHLDTQHPHVHIATTLIQKDGQRINTEGIGRKLSEPARIALEQKYRLTIAQGRRLKNESYLRVAEYGLKSTKQQLNNITKAVMRDYAYTSFATYKAVLAQFNVHAEQGNKDSVMFEKKGLIYAIMDGNGNTVGVPFKASSFYRGATMRELEKHFVRNKAIAKLKMHDLKSRVDSVLAQFSSMTSTTLQKELASHQIALLYRQNDNGLIYGLTFVDHKNRTVFNGSDLGKAYSAQAIVSRFTEKNVPMAYLKRESVSSIGVEKEVEFGHRKVEENLVDGLLAKADFDPIGKPIKKKRKKKGNDQQQNLGT